MARFHHRAYGGAILKHAGPQALDQVEKLLARLRRLEALVERKRGVFYHRSRAFLHFHEDPAGIFADVRDGDDFRRYRATTAAEWKVVVAAVERALGS